MARPIKMTKVRHRRRAAHPAMGRAGIAALQTAELARRRRLSAPAGWWQCFLCAVPEDACANRQRNTSSNAQANFSFSSVSL